MASAADPIPVDVPMPIRTPRLLIRPKQAGDGLFSARAVAETWEDLHQWMAWAENLEEFTVEEQEVRSRHQLASFLLRREFHLIGIESATGQPVVWCGFHDINWSAQQCGTGFWVRKSAQRRGFATEATNALVRYAFTALGMRRVSMTHSEGNEVSRHIIEKLGFKAEGIERLANPLPGGRLADRYCYARSDLGGLPPLDVEWD